MALRGSGIAYVNNAASGSVAFPAGTAAGDLAIVFVSHNNAAIPPELDWFQIDGQNGSNVCGSCFMATLSAAQVALGAVVVNFTGSGFGTIAVAVFVGAQSPNRTFVSLRSSTGATTRTLTTDTTPQTGDYALYFGSGGSNVTVTSGSGTSLQTSSRTGASAVLAGGALGGAGAVSDTFTFSAAPSGDYEIVLVVSPSPLATLNLRQPLIVSEGLSEGYPNLRQPLIVDEALSEGYPNLRQPLLTSDILSEGYPNVRMVLLVVEVLHPVAPEGTVSTELFPGSQGSSISLPGLQWPIHKRPKFSTAVYKGAPGFSVRRANMQYPIWEFELSYEFLRDSVNQEFQILLDFFLARQGGFDTFLFKDKDDYQVTNGVLATADGTTTQFPFVRSFAGTFYDKVGQVDNGNTITLYGTVAENHTIPNTPGPYTITVTNSATFVADGGVTKGGTPMVNVASSPAAGQYSYAAGVYTFNSADANQAVVITYRYTLNPAGYTITLPNLVVFTVAPANGLIISADFQFFFNCRFQDDVADFSKFAQTFWDLQKIILETVPQ